MVYWGTDLILQTTSRIAESDPRCRLGKMKFGIHGRPLRRIFPDNWRWRVVGGRR
jgi:hypothetical protein